MNPVSPIERLSPPPAPVLEAYALLLEACVPLLEAHAQTMYELIDELDGADAREGELKALCGPSLAAVRLDDGRWEEAR